MSNGLPDTDQVHSSTEGGNIGSLAAWSNPPRVRSQTLSGIAGVELSLKLENLQFTGSFKDRGALVRLLALTDAGRARHRRHIREIMETLEDAGYKTQVRK